MKKKLLPINWLALRYLSLCMLLLCFQNKARAELLLGQKLSDTHLKLSGTEIQLEDLLRSIENQSEFEFSYSNELSLNFKVSLKSRMVNLADLLKEISSQTSLSFRQINQTIAISGGNVSQKKPIEFLNIQGTVYDAETQETIPGVNIIIKGKNRGTTTDVNGNYSLSVEEGETLIFSFVGYQKKEVLIKNQTQIDIVLSLESGVLSEVIVTALGIKREEKAIGYAEQQVNSEALLEARSNNWSDALRSEEHTSELQSQDGISGGGVGG